MSILKTTFIFILFLLLSLPAFAQTHQIALVKPDGTTTIHNTFQSAYDAAEDDDHIYLPGGVINESPQISKKLFIYGAGMNIDSCLHSNTTTLSGITFNPEANGSVLEGVVVWNINFSGSGSNITIRNCFITAGISCGLWSNILIVNNYIGFSTYWFSTWWYDASINGDISNSVISNNFILGEFGAPNHNNLCSYIGNNLICNNTFLRPSSGYHSNYCLFTSSVYNNNIFPLNTWIISDNSTFLNNVNCSIDGIGNFEENSIVETYENIFIDPGNLTDFSFENNYHIKETSQCKNSGTDGTDRGIYGGGFPWQDGSFPSNPHINYKNIPAMTNPNGNLQINVKVKAQDN